MNAEHWKNMLPIITAFAEGKAIEYLSMGSCWNLASDLDFNYDPSCYRIKSEPKLRAWTQAEVLPLIGKAVWRHKRIDGNNSMGVVAIICGASESHIYYGPENLTKLTFQDAANLCEYSLDSGKTWLPCGVME